MTDVRDSLLQNLQYASHVVLQDRGGIQPEAGKYKAAINAVIGNRMSVVDAIHQNESVDGCVFGSPHDVFFDSVPTIRVQLVVQIIADRAGRDFHNQFRSPRLRTRPPDETARQPVLSASDSHPVAERCRRPVATSNCHR